MAIALIGIIGAVLAGDAGFFFRTAKKQEPPHRILRKAVLGATYLASQHKEIVYLRYEDEEESPDHGILFIENATGSELSRYRIFEQPDEDDVSINETDFTLIFEAEVPLAGIDGEDGDYNGDYWDDDVVSLLRVAFHPSGVSTPFLARIRTEFGEDEEKTYRFDPFSGYLRLKPEEK